MAAVKRRVCVKCGRGRAEKFFSSPTGKTCSDCKKKTASAGAHDRRVQATYGLKPGEYNELFEAQGGKCAICGGRRRERLDVDHDHKTGRVRGLLCKLCNRRLLPAARDNVETLYAAIEYLEDPPAEQHLPGIRKAPDTKNLHGAQPSGGHRSRRR